MYCNPAVPLETDTGTLREAFRALPKSGGKSFTAFNLFLLVRQLETKELKTWAELALKLGVDPPDKDKGESSQKIQQYAVRLKRWMHSMHVDAFFEYLMSIPHPYWTDIPTDPTPIYQEGRDGVAPVDDMALRALVPQARPKRGKKRAEEESLNESPSQRPRIESPASEDISLQVPERVGGSVRLATPPRPYFPPPNMQLPPEVVVNGQPNPNHGGYMNQAFSSTAAPTNVARAAAATSNPRPTAQQYTSNPAFNFETTDHEVPSLDPAPRVTPLGFFDDMEERTNIDATFGYFHSEVLRADWYDASGKRTPPCSLDEAHALVASIIEALYAAAASHAAFLINVAALAGGTMLMTTDKMQVRRLIEYEDRTHFECSWVYRLGSVKGTYRMAQTVEHERWQRSPDVSEAEDDPGTTKGSGGLWRKKYENLMKEMRAKDAELAAMKKKVLSMLDP
ncbi:hypothetical protein ACHAP1_002836 [Verticillium nonalfalfae]